MSWQSDVEQWGNRTGQTPADIKNSVEVLSEERRRLLDALEEIGAILDRAFIWDSPTFLSSGDVQRIEQICKQALNK